MRKGLKPEDLGDLLDVDGPAGHIVGLAELAFDHDEDGLHGAPLEMDSGEV